MVLVGTEIAGLSDTNSKENASTYIYICMYRVKVGVLTIPQTALCARVGEPGVKCSKWRDRTSYENNSTFGDSRSHLNRLLLLLLTHRL